MFISEVKSSYKEDISILIKPDNHPWNYLCECGDAKALSVKEIQNCNAIFISHTHIDHFVNFDAIIRHQIGIQRRIIICGPKGIAEQVQFRIKSYTWNLIDENAIVYEIREIISENKFIVYEVIPPLWKLKHLKEVNTNLIFEEKYFTVSATLLNHKTPTLAYLFKEKDTLKIDLTSTNFKGGKWVKKLKDAYTLKQNNAVITIHQENYIAQDLFYLLHIQQGDSVGIIMDHTANEENHLKIKKHFFECKKVFIESFYKNEDKELALLNYHSYASMSGKIMKECNVEKPIPVHFSRKYNEHEIQELIKEFENSFINSVQNFV